MPLKPYRQVLAIPRVPSSMVLMFFARLPMTMMGVTLTMYVVSVLGRGYGAAGLVGAATTLGSALGAPLIGRLIDRFGLRPIVTVCGISSTAFWIAVPHLSFTTLVVVAFPAGLLAVPAGSLARQVLTALVPTPHRRSAYSLDTILVEASFMIGPAAGIAAITKLPATLTLSGIGVLFGATALLLWITNPPIRSEDEQPTVLAGPRPPLRDWLSGQLIGTLFVAAGALFCLVGTEVATLAALRATGETSWTGLVIVVMCVASLVGGVIHGAVKRSLPQAALMFLLAVLVIPVGLADQPWWLLALVLIPTNVLCAPTLAATTETVGRLAPARVRGEAMGLQDASTRLGLAIGSPVVGFAIDHSSPAWGFVASGVGALLIAAIGLLWHRKRTIGPVPAMASSASASA